MKNLIDIFNESILDDEDVLDQKTEYNVLVNEVYKELTKTYGEICHVCPILKVDKTIFPSASRSNFELIKIDNISIEKNKLKFINIPHDECVIINFESISGLNCFKKYKVLCDNLCIENLHISNKYSNISDLNIEKVNTLIFEKCKVMVDKFPKNIKYLYFNRCNIYPLKKPTNYPKNCQIGMDDETNINLLGNWTRNFYNVLDFDHDSCGTTVIYK